MQLLVAALGRAPARRLVPSLRCADLDPDSLHDLWFGYRPIDSTAVDPALVFDSESADGVPALSAIEHRSLGVLLGKACGDALGAAGEFLEAEEIVQKWGWLHSSPSALGAFRYTDDTEMALALAHSLVDRRLLDGRHCAATYAAFYADGGRGYGPSVSSILKQLHTGELEYRTSGTSQFPSGSYANGGAMRIAPLAVAFHRASESVLRDAVRVALLPTHVHIDAIESAVAQALLVQALLDSDAAALTDEQLGALVESVQARSLSDELRSKLAIVLSEWRERIATRASGTTLNADEDDDAPYPTPPDVLPSDVAVLERLVTPSEFGKRFQIRGTEAMACACWALLNYWRTPEEAVVRVVSWGGDADTVGTCHVREMLARHRHQC